MLLHRGAKFQWRGKLYNNCIHCWEGNCDFKPGESAYREGPVTCEYCSTCLLRHELLITPCVTESLKRDPELLAK